MKEAIDNYFITCDKEEKPYGIVALALHLGIARKTLLEYQEKKEFRNTIEMAKQRVEAYVEEKLLLGTGNGSNLQFYMKNNAPAWKDKQTIEHNDITELSEDQLKAKLSNLLSK